MAVTICDENHRRKCCFKAVIYDGKSFLRAKLGYHLRVVLGCIDNQIVINPYVDGKVFFELKNSYGMQYVL